MYSRHPKLSAFPTILILLLFAISGSSKSRLSAEENRSATDLASSVSGLARVFEPGWFLKDKNGDGQVDFVSVRIVLPRVAAPSEVAAATAVAARLALETSGLNLPLVFPSDRVLAADGTPTILIGTGNELLSEAVVKRALALDPGQGLVTWAAQSVIIAGHDPLGTQVAGEAFAARSPYLWSIIGRQNGDTFEKISRHIEAHLSEIDITPESVSFDEIVFEAERKEAVRVTVRVELGSGETERVRASLQALVQEHRQGRQTELLSYASVAELAIQLAEGRESSMIILPRIGLPQAVINPPRRPTTRFQTVRPSGRGRGSASRPAPARTFDLSEVFGIEKGLLRDRDRDQIPDDAEMMIVIPGTVPAGESATSATAHLAARLGLESTGLTFPLLGFDSELEDPELDRRPLVLIGHDNELVRELDRQGKLRGSGLPEGRGRIEVVPEALNGSSAVVITGHNAASEAAAIDYLSRRAPYLWEIGRGGPDLPDSKKLVAGFLDGKTTESQAALAVAELEELLEDLDDLELESISIDGYFEEQSSDFEVWLTRQVKATLDVAEVRVETHRRHDPVEVFSEEPELEWEVDAFWSRFREAAGQIAADSSVEVEIRVSEAPELRADLERQVRAEIRRLGAVDTSVKVFSAYKQGLSWLMDDIAPRLRDREAAEIEIGWRPLEVDTTQDQRFYNEPARWLNELYPADDVLAVALSVPLTAILFVMQPDLEETYRVTAKDSRGSILLDETFSPKYYERPYLETFPEVARSLVTTGWLSMRVDERQVVDERIPTDLDLIWDHYQKSTLKQVHDHVRSTTGRRPTAEKAPFFHTLRIELETSEPDFRLGIDEEHISSIESLHDSFYFDTLDFFYEMAQSAMERDQVAPRSLAPGNILPWMHPERRGQAPTLKISYSGFASKDPKLVIKYREVGGEEKTETKLLKRVKGPEPFLFLAETEEGATRLSRLGFLVTLEDTKPLGRLTDLLENLMRFQLAGFFEGAFKLSSVDQIEIRLEAPGVARTRTYKVDETAKRSNPVVSAGGRLVAWDHVISPAESEQIAHTLGTLPNVTTYVAGQSYQKRPVSVMEIKLPMEADLISQAKLSTWKPVLSITGRQHANEVSSTSHILRLAELLATDSEFQGYLQKMNVVIQPVVNPDGAALAFELQKLTPTHCLHAGRYSALGPDVPGQANRPDTLVTEALVLSEIRNTWVPDIILNPHGYPSHEWVQHFANYNPKSFRSYWIPRGWYTSVRIPEHPGLEDARAVSLALRDRIAEEVSRDPEARQTNLRIYDRYRRWALRWQPHVYNLEIHNDTAIYWSRTGGSDQRPPNGPQTTIFSGYTEAMDETAQDPWLDLVTRMGFGYLMASVKFLEEAQYELYRLEEERSGRVHIAVTRPRPVRPGQDQ